MKSLLHFSKILVFSFVLSSVVLFSVNANVQLDNMAIDYRSLFLSNSTKNIEPQTMLLLGIGLIGIAGLSRKKLKK